MHSPIQLQLNPGLIEQADLRNLLRLGEGEEYATQFGLRLMSRVRAIRRRGRCRDTIAELYRVDATRDEFGLGDSV